MRFTIENDLLFLDGKQVEYRPTPNVGGRMKPRIGVVHETASSSFEGTVGWLTNKRSRVSCPIVIGRKEGEIIQLAPFDRITWHAGKSKWRDCNGCNAIAIGAELVGPGKLIKTGTNARAWFGTKYPIDALGIKRIKTRAHGDGWWMKFTDWQLRANEALWMALVEHYGLEDVVAHWEISPGRKVDPNPTFDMEDLRSAAFGVASEQSAPETAFSVLQVGSRSRDVELAQRRLKSLGYDQVGEADGIYGPMTRAAVLAWQAEQDRATTGKLEIEGFKELLGSTAKPMAVGEVSAARKAKRQNSARSAEAVAGFSFASLIAEKASTEVVGVSLWGMIKEGMGEAIGAVDQVKQLGLSINPETALYVLAGVVSIAIWRWARQAREG